MQIAQPIAGVKHLIAVASGKGGVGKSTVAVNLALALAQTGARVGLLDADIYGPSLPVMLGAHNQPAIIDKKIQPLNLHGIQAMSIGYLVAGGTAMIWRGPMATSALQQLLYDTLWDNLDYLMIDLPPGTGDIHLSLVQKAPLTGAVIVTTPQRLALVDAERACEMFGKVHVPLLGIIENMSTHQCSHCGHTEAIFGQGAGATLAKQFDTPLLGSLPLAARIGAETDRGTPTVVTDPHSIYAKDFQMIAAALQARVTQLAASGNDFPEIIIKND